MTAKNLLKRIMPLPVRRWLRVRQMRAGCLLHPTTYVDWNQDRNYEDMCLMNSCRALPMANRSFSWRAGWLNARPDKLAVAPPQCAPGAVPDLLLSPWLVAI